MGHRRRPGWAMHRESEVYGDGGTPFPSFQISEQCRNTPPTPPPEGVGGVFRKNAPQFSGPPAAAKRPPGKRIPKPARKRNCDRSAVLLQSLRHAGGESNAGKQLERPRRSQGAEMHGPAES